MARSPTLTATSPRIQPRWMWLLGFIGLLAVVYLISQTQPWLAGNFPENWNLGLRGVINNFQSWVIGNRNTHPLFVLLLDPFSAAVDAALRAIEDALITPPWTAIVAVFALLGWAAKGWRLALFCVAALFIAGLFGLWEPTLQTLALIIAAVLLSLLIGIPIGVLAAQSKPFNAALRPILDTMQTMPAFVYLIPVVLFFGIARVPAVIATMIYAIPPVIRLTTLGIQQVPPATIEAACAFGSTPRQILWKVQLPQAVQTILAGVNQTIMMALGMVVIAAMIGAGGLGREVFLTLQRLQVGQAFEAGLIIVLVAIMLDRISEGFGKKDFVRWAGQSRAHKLQPLVIFVALVGLATALGFFAFPYNTFPLEWRALIRGPIDAGVRWVRDNFYWLTGGISDFLTIYLLNALRDLFLRLPWPVVVAAFTAIAYRTNAGRTGGWQLALGSALGLITIGLLGMWPLSMDTLSQVIITMLVTMLVALPLGVLASQFKWASAALRPINDFLQTIPTFVFLVPVLMLFNVGRVPGLIAAALYAIPVGIKLTELGLRQVAPESIEAARAFGSTRSQIITKVQLPLARTAISVAINQMIMMVLAMVIISGMVGGAGLGLEAVTGLARNQTGQGLEAGLAIVILAIVCDRISQAWAAARE